ncbi:hypothetical protein BH10PSE14_BH10PSE14_19700 [soil metagenome]
MSIFATLVAIISAIPAHEAPRRLADHHFYIEGMDYLTPVLPAQEIQIINPDTKYQYKAVLIEFFEDNLASYIIGNMHNSIFFVRWINNSEIATSTVTAIIGNKSIKSDRISINYSFCGCLSEVFYMYDGMW